MVLIRKTEMIRVDKDFANTINNIKTDMQKVIGKPVTRVQVTKILNRKLREDNMTSNIIFYKKRGKRVVI